MPAQLLDWHQLWLITDTSDNIRRADHIHGAEPLRDQHQVFHKGPKTRSRAATQGKVLLKMTLHLPSPPLRGMHQDQLSPRTQIIAQVRRTGQPQIGPEHTNPKKLLPIKSKGIWNLEFGIQKI